MTFYFIAKATEISKSQVAFIISNALLFSEKAQKLRNFILDYYPIEKIINFEKYQVFEEASITAMMMFFNKNHQGYCKVNNFTDAKYDKKYIISNVYDDKSFFNVHFKKDNVFALVNDVVNRLNKKIDGQHNELGFLFKVGSGMQTAANNAYSFKEYPYYLENTNYIRKHMSGEIINRYYHKRAIGYLLYLEDENSFDGLPNELKSHLEGYRNKLENRAEIIRNRNRVWWKYSFPMHKEYYSLPKIWTSYRSKNNTFCFDGSNEYIGLTNTTVIFATNVNLDIKYVLALLNSKALNFRYKSIGKQTGNGIYEYFENQISKLPIPEISKNEQQYFIERIDKILTAKEEDQDACISDVENEINRAVYALYGLNDEDVKFIENTQTN